MCIKVSNKYYIMKTNYVSDTIKILNFIYVLWSAYTCVSTQCFVHVQQGKKRVLGVIPYLTSYIPLRQDLFLNLGFIFSLVGRKTASFSNLHLYATPGERIRNVWST